jgi:hypothetical protein
MRLTRITVRQIQQDHRLLTDMQRLGIRENLADSVRRAGCDAYLGFLEVFDLFGDFEVFCEKLREEWKIRLNAWVEGRGVGVPLRSRLAASGSSSSDYGRRRRSACPRGRE